MMKKQFTLIVLLFTLVNQLFAQFEFEKGYYIDLNDQRHECFIRNFDWRNNPTEFEFKLNPEDSASKLYVSSVKEFRVDGYSKYISARVNIDRSGYSIQGMSKERNPVFNEEILFLKVLAEGSANLFYYEDQGLTRFFYSKAGGNIHQLVYKRYLTSQGIAENNLYLQQLLNEFQTQGINSSDIKRIAYNQQTLVPFFNKLNGNALPVEGVKSKENLERILTGVTIRPGIQFSSLKLNYLPSDSRDIIFGKAISPGIGIEAEFLVSYKKEEWGIIFEPTLNRFNATETKETNQVIGGIINAEVAYHSIELPIGLRYHFYSQNKSDIYLNAGFIADLNSDSFIFLKRQDGSVLNEIYIKSWWNMMIGAGYRYNDQFNIELRYHTPRQVLSGVSGWDASYNSIRMVIGYSIY